MGARPAGYVCRHLDGDKTNNALENLAWGTPAENGADKVRLGESCPGERNGRARLTTADVRAIRAAPTAYGLAPRLAAQYGVAVVTIHKIRQRKIWRGV